MSKPVAPGAPSRAAALVRQLQALWEQRQQPDADALLRAAGVSSPAEVAEVLAADQWQRWHAGQRLSVEDYLARHPALAADPTALLALAYGEFLIREEFGEGPTAAEYLARFPQCADGLGRQFEFHGAFAEADATFDGGEQGPVKAVPPQAAPAVPGYELLGEVGRGGMGVVYKARQRGLHRLVAVKMLRAGVEAGPDELARFRTEAEAVARLQHPNIVQIYEVGEVDGRPFLSLEFVDGHSLNSYLAGTPQPPAAAAALVEVLARAMAVAHQHGIVHRDLKPSNILLATARGMSPAHAGAGQRGALASLVPKIADFGLAKLLPGRVRAAAPDVQTQSGVILGTPSYMAPEQARGRSKEVGPSADLYALGAIFYECLTGRPPFAAESSWETLRQVIHDEPVPPSSLQPKLPRDVETICLKCLQKDPRRRYDSAEALADDLRRFVAGRPIRARAVGAAGRLRRWVRREPAVAGLLAALLLALIGGLTGMGLLWRRAEANYAASRRHYDRAEESLRDARQAVEEMLGEVGEECLKDVPEMETVQRALLEKAAAFYDKFLSERGDDPALREEAARAYGRLARIRQQLGRLTEAEAAFVKALALHTALAQEAPGEARFRRLMADDLCRGLAQLYLNGFRHAEAEAMLSRAREILEPLAAEHGAEQEYQVDLADCYNKLGSLWLGLSRFDQAESAFGDSLKIRQRLARQRPADAVLQDQLAASHNNLAVVYQNSKRADRAEAEYKQALALWEALAGGDRHASQYRRSVGVCHQNLGWLYLVHLGQVSKAEASLGKARQVREALSREHPSFVGYQTELAETYRVLGMAYERLGRPDETERLDLQALEIMERYPSDVPKARFELANTYQILAWHYFSAGKIDQAESFYRKALTQCDALVQQFPEVRAYRRTLGFIHNGRGGVYAAQKRFKDAEAAYGEAVRLREELVRATQGEAEALEKLASSYAALGSLYANTVRPELAAAASDKALAAQERLVREHGNVPTYAVSLAVRYSARADRLVGEGKAQEALDDYGRAIRLLQDVLKDEPRHAEARRALSTSCCGRAAVLSKHLLRHKEALPDWDRARAYDDGANWDEIWVHQAITLARLGEHTRATADMQALQARAAAEHKAVKEKTYHVMAFVYALSATAAGDDSQLSPAGRTRLGSEYAARAVELLRRLLVQGYFKELKEVEDLRRAPELEVLRPRDDFQKLLQEMEQKRKTG
jgi:serine/threonine-protein kinase